MSKTKLCIEIREVENGYIIRPLDLSMQGQAYMITTQWVAEDAVSLLTLVDSLAKDAIKKRKENE